MIRNSLNKLESYINDNEFSGYDPYDTLNSYIPFKYFGKWVPILAIQLQKRNPFNIRKILGIKRAINPKAIGLLLKANCILYKLSNDEKYRNSSKILFDWLKNNYSKGYSGYCWGYNFDWANKDEYLEKYIPNVVVTGTVIDGIYEYYEVFKDEEAKKIIKSASDFVYSDLPIISINSLSFIGYNIYSKNCCYNASLYGALILAISNKIEQNIKYKDLIHKVVDYIISKQNKDGSWYYSYNIKTKIERKQIDFHQGFILVLLDDIMHLTNIDNPSLNESIKNGMIFYKKKQFSSNGVSIWRLPKKWPIDIHNQAQGIITFAKLSFLDKNYFKFSERIAKWTINNMQNSKGFFYYQNFKFYKNKISYMRWSQAWMFLALAKYEKFSKKYNNDKKI
jgi:hypothetical protein